MPVAHRLTQRPPSPIMELMEQVADQPQVFEVELWREDEFILARSPAAKQATQGLDEAEALEAIQEVIEWELGLSPGSVRAVPQLSVVRKRDKAPSS